MSPPPAHHVTPGPWTSDRRRPACGSWQSAPAGVKQPASRPLTPGRAGLCAAANPSIACWWWPQARDTRSPPPPTPPPRARPGNATLIGASANIVTATMLDKAGHHVTFNQWLRYGAPVMVVSVAVANLYLFRYAF